jgi:RNA polymerase-interacting CarD/CdnL/TRCF family regulator
MPDGHIRASAITRVSRHDPDRRYRDDIDKIKTGRVFDIAEILRDLRRRSGAIGTAATRSRRPRDLAPDHRGCVPAA